MHFIADLIYRSYILIIPHTHQSFPMRCRAAAVHAHALQTHADVPKVRRSAPNARSHSFSCSAVTGRVSIIHARMARILRHVRQLPKHREPVDGSSLFPVQPLCSSYFRRRLSRSLQESRRNYVLCGIMCSLALLERLLGPR